MYDGLFPIFRPKLASLVLGPNLTPANRQRGLMIGPTRIFLKNISRPKKLTKKTDHIILLKKKKTPEEHLIENQMKEDKERNQEASRI